MDGAAVVVGRGTEIIELENNHLTASLRDVGVRDVRGKTADAIVDRGCRDSIVDVNKSVVGKVRIEGDPQQAALARRCGCYREKGSRQQCSILDDPQLPRLQADEEPAVR
jgi:hypothetical protein